MSFPVQDVRRASDDICLDQSIVRRATAAAAAAAADGIKHNPAPAPQKHGANDEAGNRRRNRSRSGLAELAGDVVQGAGGGSRGSKEGGRAKRKRSAMHAAPCGGAST